MKELYKGYKVFYFMKNFWYWLFVSWFTIIAYLVTFNYVFVHVLHYSFFDLGILVNNLGCLFLLALVMVLCWRKRELINALKDLAVLAYTGGFFSKENKSLLGEKSKEIIVTYWPKMYLRYKDNMKIITFKIVSTKFQKLEDIDSLLEDRFSMEVVGKEKSKGFITYYLDKTDASSALIINTKAKHKKFKVPITDNFEWDIVEAPHGLITGTTNSGKSYLLMYLIRSFMSMGCDVHIIDGKKSKLYHLETILGKEKVAHENAQILKQLRLAEEEMYRRQEVMKQDAEFYEKNQNETFVSFGLVPYVLAIDEFLAIRLRLKKEEEKEYRERLFQLILQGREVGVYVILTTQRADAEFLDGAIRDNLHFRVSLGNLSKEGYRMTFGDLKSGFKSRNQFGHGYLYVYTQSTVVRELYAPIIPKSYNFYSDIRALAGGARGASAETKSATE